MGNNPDTRAYWVESLTINAITVAGFLGSNDATFRENVNRDRVEFNNSLNNYPGPMIGWEASFEFEALENIKALLDATFPETSSSDPASIYEMVLIVRDTAGNREKYTGQVYLKQEVERGYNRRKTGSVSLTAEFIFDTELDRPYTKEPLTEV